MKTCQVSQGWVLLGLNNFPGVLREIYGQHQIVFTAELRFALKLKYNKIYQRGHVHHDFPNISI